MTQGALQFLLGRPVDPVIQKVLVLPNKAEADLFKNVLTALVLSDRIGKHRAQPEGIKGITECQAFGLCAVAVTLDGIVLQMDTQSAFLFLMVDPF